MEVEAACKDLFSTAVLGFNLCVWDWRITDAKYAKPQNRIVPSWMQVCQALPHFNVVIVLSFTGFCFKLKKPLRSCKRNEFVNKSWHRNSRCLGISQTTYGIWVDLVKTTGDRGIFWKNTFKVLPFPNHHSCSLWDIYCRCRICTLCVLLFHIHWTILQMPSYPSLLPCHLQEELKQLKEQKELQQDHLGLRVEGLVTLSDCQQGAGCTVLEQSWR